MKDTAGRLARKGFSYQDSVFGLLFLKYLNNENIEIINEGKEDIVITNNKSRTTFCIECKSTNFDLVKGDEILLDALCKYLDEDEGGPFFIVTDRQYIKDIYVYFKVKKNDLKELILSMNKECIKYGIPLLESSTKKNDSSAVSDIRKAYIEIRKYKHEEPYINVGSLISSDLVKVCEKIMNTKDESFSKREKIKNKQLKIKELLEAKIKSSKSSLSEEEQIKVILKNFKIWYNCTPIIVKSLGVSFLKKQIYNSVEDFNYGDLFYKMVDTIAPKSAAEDREVNLILFENRKIFWKNFMSKEVKQKIVREKKVKSFGNIENFIFYRQHNLYSMMLE